MLNCAMRSCGLSLKRIRYDWAVPGKATLAPAPFLWRYRLKVETEVLG